MEDTDSSLSGEESELDDEYLDFSLDDLGAAYARAAAAHDPESFAPPPDSEPTSPDESADPRDGAPAGREEEQDAVHPQGIVEAALFVGHPDNQPLTAAKLASLMRNVSESEVVEIVESLNHSYKAASQAFRIVEDESGYRLTIAPAVEGIRRSFLGKVREARLSQAAVEVLSLVAYQPGVTAQTIQDQRGKESGALLNQLVRRRLLEIKRRAPEDGGRKVPHFYPTERFLALFALDSLDDLPLVDESFLGNG